ncbi:substrate-binding domain-containing protein [Streptomyces sp. cg35]|uniref:LacI family DNA-binding transcriptional regulator n=1 Tax=Streptomyces sp. cg35 TaxID=3421650 RepID=UPI003D17ADDA
MSAPQASAGTAVRGQKARSLAEELRKGIAELRWPAGRLPTEQALAREQGVSLNTVRRAVDLLVQDGLVYRKQGSGTYIATADKAEAGPLVGVAVPSMTYYYPRIIGGIERELARHGAQMMLRSTDWDPATERQAIENLANAGAAGLLLVPGLGETASGLWTDGLDGLGLPVVLVERGLEIPATLDEFVASNHAAGAHSAIRHLVELGHTRIGYLERASAHTAAQVRSGLRAGLQNAGLGPDPTVSESLTRWTPKDAERFLDRLIAHRATAALCFADREAALLVSVAGRRGLDVPGDLSVIGYDDEVADLSEVPLTAVSPAKAEIGRLAVNVLRARLSDPDAPRRQESLVPRLVVRDSTGPVRHG